MNMKKQITGTERSNTLISVFYLTKLSMSVSTASVNAMPMNNGLEEQSQGVVVA
jgi:hypothetical protein